MVLWIMPGRSYRRLPFFFAGFFAAFFFGLAFGFAFAFAFALAGFFAGFFAAGLGAAGLAAGAGVSGSSSPMISSSSSASTTSPPSSSSSSSPDSSLSSSKLSFSRSISILPLGNPPRYFGAGRCVAGVNASSNACGVVIALPESCQAFCETAQESFAPFSVHAIFPGKTPSRAVARYAPKLLIRKELVLWVGFGRRLCHIGRRARSSLRFRPRARRTRFRRAAQRVNPQHHPAVHMI